MAITTKVLPEKWDMTVYAGDVWPAWNFNVVDDTNTPITDFTVLMQIRKFPLGDVVKELAGGNGFIVTAENVKFNTTVDLPVYEYVHDIQIILANSEVHSQYAGKIIVTQDITRIVSP